MGTYKNYKDGNYTIEDALLDTESSRDQQEWQDWGKDAAGVIADLCFTLRQARGVLAAVAPLSREGAEMIIQINKQLIEVQGKE